jgi:ribosomal protein S18 acetylase RimI-like enzyme
MEDYMITIEEDPAPDKTFRRKGVGKLLMDAAESYARETGAARIVLSTPVSNTPAQKLYEARGDIKDEEFHHYALRL